MSFVMFDLDGTLVDTSALYLTGVPLVVQRHLGRSIAIDDYMDLWGHDVRQWFERACLAVLSAEARSAKAEAPEERRRVETMYADFEAFYMANHHLCPVYSGVAEGVARLNELGHTIGVVTTRPQRRAELVRDFSWSSTLDFIVGGDRVSRRKPFPDSLDFAVDRYGLHMQDGVKVYVGDNALDMQAARASRHSIVSAAAMWGARDRNSLLESRPQQVFTTFRDCADWLIGLTT